MSKTVKSQCNLCEAHCGITVTVEGDHVTRITGDPDDHMSKGYICPKAASLADLHHDPDRLKRPVKKVDGEFVEIDWEEALDLAAEGIRKVQAEHGNDAVAFYLGNPAAHGSGVIPGILVRQLLGTRNKYSASSADQFPQHLVYQEMFGNFAMLPIPDINRTDYMIVMGANPSVSNGSIMTAPGARHRLDAIIERGGKVVVVDPRRTETVKHASEHVAVRPGGDPYLLLGMLNVIFDEGLEDLSRLGEWVEGLAELKHIASEWTPERAAPLAGVEAEDIARIAREFASAEKAVLYGRVGICQQRNGSVAHWLVTAVNIVTGNFDREGGLMFPRGPLDQGIVRMLPRSRNTQRVSGMGSLLGDLPSAGLADEINTPGEGQVKAMLTYAGNPVISTSGGGKLDEAMEKLDWCVAVDMYVTETTRHADVILPPISHLEREEWDFIFPTVSVRNHLRVNQSVIDPPPDSKTDWEIMMELARRLGDGAKGAVQNNLMRAFDLLSGGPARVMDLALLGSPYGVLRRGPFKGITADKVRKSGAGIDLGPLEPRMPSIMGKGKIDLSPGLIVDAARRLEEIEAEREAAAEQGFDLTLIGRRQLRSNNSWLHNSARLMKGDDRCTARLHPDDADSRGLDEGDRVAVSSAIGTIEVPLEVTDEIRPGVVSVPHGFGHTRSGVGWKLAASKPGASFNDIADPSVVDELSGNAGFNAVPVKVELVGKAADAERAEAAVA